MRGKQRYRCKACGLNFTDTPLRGKPLALKVAAVLLYVSGLSMNRTAQLLGVSTPTIQAWLEQFAATYAQKPEPEGRAVVIELDEMWHSLKKSPNRSGSGRHGIVRDNARQRHWLARFRRRSIVVSKTTRMVDVSIALFARCAGNNRIADLVSMLA